ncbi:AraC family transcriptional regulator [Opitutaceae bacterium]|nr:AraC family transcriptional regulator [Opitutaceae bacterium]
MVHANPSSTPVQPAMPPGEEATHRLRLFEYLNDICYFAKDRAHRFTAANKALVRLVGQRDQRDVIGKTDYDFNAPYLADSYEKDDEHVMSSGESITNKVELVTHNDLSVEWYTTTKIPLFDASGTIVGLEGFTREFKVASAAAGPYPELSNVIDFVERNHANRITVADLAGRAGFTVRTLERLFQKRFNMSPFAYLKRVRLNGACRLLTQSNLSLAQIATDSGFCDQSYMTKEFARLMRITPQAYRDSHTA